MYIDPVGQFVEEDGDLFNLEKLRARQMELGDYKKAHEGLVICCHDIFVVYDGRVLLVRRDNKPAKGILWPLGGRLQRGVDVEESLAMKTKQESGLSIDDISFLGVERTMFESDPFGHGKGTDTVNLVYSARGVGSVRLDGMHIEPTLVSRSDYLNMRQRRPSPFHPYVEKYMDKLWLGNIPKNLVPDGKIPDFWIN